MGISKLSIYLTVAETATSPYGWMRFSQVGLAVMDKLILEIPFGKVFWCSNYIYVDLFSSFNQQGRGNKGSTKGLGEYVGQTKEDLQKFQGNENGVGRIGQRMRPKPRWSRNKDLLLPVSRGASTLLRSSNGGSNWG
ncbi:hypothetical protein V6N11_055244 [Hibiscus sabdariffa]|uniref:Uncharacterized protein n=1 Tax=Hibiscus sabdariffa TaxID=183260 RepID=A0ABR2PF43_9ROSI